MAFNITIKPIGNLGNRIAQLLVCIWLAEQHKGRVETRNAVQNHPLLESIPPVFDFSNGRFELRPIAAEWCRFPTYKKAWPPESDARRIMQTYLLPYMPIPEVTPSKFVMNIRSGDIFTQPSLFKVGYHGVPGKFFCPPPVEYYNHIIDREKPSKITIVSTDRVNPVINELLKLHSNAEFSHQSVELDFATVASAQTLVMSYSSFTESAFLASNVVERCYSMFLGHMLRTDVHRTEYQDKRFISAPWSTSKERDMDLLNWDYRANFIDHSPI